MLHCKMVHVFTLPLLTSLGLEIYPHQIVSNRNALALEALDNEMYP